MVDTQTLPSWNDGAVKAAILDFVARITKEGGADFVPPAERISTFDMDGTLWCEQPLQVQVFFLFGRVDELSAEDPALVERSPFKAVLEHDYNTLLRLGTPKTSSANARTNSIPLPETTVGLEAIFP